MDRFQYRIVKLGVFRAADRMAAAFGMLGKDGWELIGVYDKSSNWIGNVETGFALFKRSVPEGSEPDGPWSIVDEVDRAERIAASEPDDGSAKFYG